MKKHLRIASIVMAFVMVITSVAFVNTTKLEAKSKYKVTVKGAKGKMTLKVGDKKTFKVKVKAPKSKGKAFTAKSTNKSTLRVVKYGKKIIITALKPGKAKVIVKAKNNKKIKKVIKITVKAKKNPQKPTVKPVDPTVKPVEPTTVAPEPTVTPEPTGPTPETTVAPEPTTKGQFTTEESVGGFDNGDGDNINDLLKP